MKHRGHDRVLVTVFSAVLLFSFLRINDAFTALPPQPFPPEERIIVKSDEALRQQHAARAPTKKRLHATTATTTEDLQLDDEPENSTFGRQDYWDDVYKKELNYSWYAGWDDLSPFVDELLLLDDDAGATSTSKETINILIPGVGNDATLVDMFDYGYSCLTAMDYAPEGIERCRDMLGPSRIVEDDPEREGTKKRGVRLVVADARNLTNVFEENEFDAVIEKGTLDAIFLGGGSDKAKAMRNLQVSISELGRCLKPGGTWISIAAVAVDQIHYSFDSNHKDWICIVDKDDLYVTEDGYTSNNIDGDLLVWKKENEQKATKN